MQNRKDKLRTIVEEYWRKDLPATTERMIRLKIESDLINDIIGPRRAGKTYLMFSIIGHLLENGVKKDATIYINFENRRLLPISQEYFNDLIEIIYAKKLMETHELVYIFLDEVQRVNEWEKYVRSIYDEFKGRIKIFISGSTSKLTESDLGHLLTGRHLTTVVSPLSFKEFLSFKEYSVKNDFFIEQDIAVIKELLREYLEYGGFPEVVRSAPDKEELIQTLFMDIINRDILPKTKRRSEIVEDLAYFLCSNSGKLASFSKITRMLTSIGINVSVPTLEKYLTIMKDSFLFFDLKIYSYKVKDAMHYPRKIYCIDTGFVNFAGFKFSEDRGRLIENLVATELMRDKAKNPLMGLFYWKDSQEREVDFVIRRGLDVDQLVQVTYASNKEDIKKREITTLLKASEEFACDNLLVITWGYEAEEAVDRRNIIYKPLWKWLVEK
jgi:hypothetical protein